METLDLPNLRHLRVFEAVARLESLGRAAAEVNRSQPAVTQALAKLEVTLGVTLIERRHSGSYLTELGSILLGRTRRLFSLLDEALAEPLVGPPFAERDRIRQILHKITTNQVRCLVAAAEAVSIEQAARQVGLSPSSLTRSVRELEQILGRSLTRHTANGLSLTPSGAELARQMRLACTELEYAREEIAAAQGNVQTQVAIGAMPQCAKLVLTTAIEAFLAQEPGARIRVEDGPYEALLDDLRMGRIDFLFGVLRKPDWASDVSEEPLFEDPYAIMVRKHHPLTHKGSLCLDDLADYDWILPRLGTPRRMSFERLFEGARRKPRSSIETRALDMLVTMIGTSDRITLMPEQEIRRAAIGGTVVALDRLPRIARGSDGVATRAGWRPTAGKLLFLEQLRVQARKLTAGAPRPNAMEASRPPRRRRSGPPAAM